MGDSDYDLLSFSHPHNEFLQIWSLYGFVALMCILILFVKSFNIANLKKEKNIWILFLFITFIQASTDTVFMDYQLLGTFLIVLGNLFAKKELQ